MLSGLEVRARRFLQKSESDSENLRLCLNNAIKCSSADTKPLHSLFCDFLTSVWLLVFVF